eukprot:6175831-Pleurochrysis_carterae.AAC.1
MNSAKSTSVSLLYRGPPCSARSTNGVRSVEAIQSANHSSAVAVRRAEVASMTLAQLAATRRPTFASADADGSASPQRSMSTPSSARPRPIASTFVAMASAVTLRARAPCPSTAASSGSDAFHMSASARAAARGGSCSSRPSGAAAPSVPPDRPARPYTSLPQGAVGRGCPSPRAPAPTPTP